MAKPRQRLLGFTLIELLTVMAIIAILIAISVAAMSGVMRKGGRDRARAEIKAFESALESYKSDNGSYPMVTGGFSTTNDYTTASPTSANGKYQNASACLYEQLSGYTNAGYVYGALTQPPSHVYYPFRPAQLANNKPAAGGPIYVKDPWGTSYGYFLTTIDSSGPIPVTNAACNGAGQYDLWSTASDPSNPPTNKASWITDWSN